MGDAGLETLSCTGHLAAEGKPRTKAFREFLGGPVVRTPSFLMGLLRFSISSWSSFAKFYFSKNLSISSTLSILLAYRGSAAVLGIALIANVAGDVGMGPIMIVGAVPLYNVFAVIILAIENRNDKDRNLKELIKQAIKGVCTNPIIISLFVGFMFSFMDWDFPGVINDSVSCIAKLTTPLALICIGASFKGAAAIKMLGPTVTATLIKLVIQPLLFLPVAAKLGFGVAEMAAVLVMLGAPTTPSCYIMAKNMGHEGTLTASVVALTTVLSAFTVTFFVFFMKSVGWI